MIARARRAVSDRAGGVSVPPYDTFNLGADLGDDPVAVTANRVRLAGQLGVPVGRLVWMSQVHGTRVAVVDRPTRSALAETDALVTSTPGLALVVQVADCVPVLLVDAEAGVVAVAHAGRRGAAGGIITRTVEAMAVHGARPDRVDVLMGPAICGRCYEVPADLQAEVEAALPGSACETAAGTAGLDLRAGIARALLAHGVGKVVADPRCTAEDPGLFSYRRDGVTGRQVGIAWLRPSA